MRARGSRIGLLIALGLLPWLASAQNAPHLGYVYPAGGQQGTSFEVNLGGQRLRDPTNAIVSGAGVTAIVLEYNRPLNQQEFNDLRDRFAELRQKKRISALMPAEIPTNIYTVTFNWSEADDAAIEDIRDRVLKNPPNRQGNPAIAETVLLRITIAPEAEPGAREIRVVTAAGVSNPLRFCVGQFPEFSTPLAKVMPPEIGFLRDLKPSKVPEPSASNSTRTITLPAVVNGQIMPGAVDRIAFSALKGQRLVASLKARDLIPYIADAVPGWFQAVLTLRDSRGAERAYSDDYQFDPDPKLFLEIPKDGDYVLEVRDSIYRGRQDFAYRLTVGEVPFLTDVFPLGGETGMEHVVEVRGWNLSTNKVTVAGDRAGVREVSTRNKAVASNPLPFSVDTLPECREAEPNSTLASAQFVTLPIIVNGRVSQTGDSDVFSFTGRAGDEIVAEVYARRLESPLDSLLRLTDANGRELALNDDHEDKGAALKTHHADSRLTAVLPTNGTYYVHLSDTQHRGGPEYAYRLRISLPQPDFALRIVPSSLTVRAGARTTFTVYALRIDGFSNSITLGLSNAPPGFALAAASLNATQDQAQVTLIAPPNPTPLPVNLSLEGSATTDGHALRRTAVPADDLMQAFFYRHLVPAQDWSVLVIGRPRPNNQPNTQANNRPPNRKPPK